MDAHRHMLLDQALDSFRRCAYAEMMPHISSFRFRVVSGSLNHDDISDIQPDDDLLIISKDCLARHPECLDTWLAGEDEVFLIVDEAHHSTAKTYRRVIDYVRSKVRNLKLIGLTATPFRTAADEQGLLGEIYTDDIAFQINLKDLISRKILSRPIFESCYTDGVYGAMLPKFILL